MFQNVQVDLDTAYALARLDAQVLPGALAITRRGEQLSLNDLAQVLFSNEPLEHRDDWRKVFNFLEDSVENFCSR
jgi:hypothetical protein